MFYQIEIPTLLSNRNADFFLPNCKPIFQGVIGSDEDLKALMGQKRSKGSFRPEIKIEKHSRISRIHWAR